MGNWSGVRSGWNTRGGTPMQHQQLDNYAGPNSAYWKVKAEQERLKLFEVLGDDFELWMEATWPDETIQLKSYKEI